MDEIDDLWTWDKIYEDMIIKYGNRVFETDTTGIVCNKSAWARKVVENIYNIKRSDLTETACHFSYIKFAIRNDGKFVGIVGGKSQFHHKYPSDVLFYDINLAKKKKAAQVMIKNKLTWCEEKIIILVNEVNDDSGKEARANEKLLQRDYNLFG